MSTEAGQFHDVVENLYARTAIQFGDEPDLGLELVMRVGFQELFQWSLTAFCTSGGQVKKKAQKTYWKSVTEDAGARASVFLALGIAEIMGKGGEEVARQRDAIEAFHPSPEDKAFIKEVLGEVSAEDACVALSLRALEIAAGKDATRSLPPFSSLGELDWRNLLRAQNYEWTMATMLLPRFWTDAIQSFHEAG